MAATKKRKVALDEKVLERYLKFLMGFKDKEFEVIWRSAHFCKLPGNPELPEVLDIDIADVFPTCVTNLSPEAEQRISERIKELQEFHDSAAESGLLAHAEEEGVEILLAADEQFIKNLGPQARGVAILNPAQYVERYLSPSKTRT